MDRSEGRSALSPKNILAFKDVGIFPGEYSRDAYGDPIPPEMQKRRVKTAYRFRRDVVTDLLGQTKGSVSQSTFSLFFHCSIVVLLSVL